ncbi:MAG: NCS2 family permease [Planctomycetota bacterium]|jgi:AGZA family xanthine/uracil permease-like MFS transporter|nr:NCS2 family permease [Planctomycetota bacterium]
MLERFFKLRNHKTTVGTEAMAGLLTFLTAVYILAVNPMILSGTGMPRDALFTATALAIIVGTLLMGLFANMPFILAPGMGINVFFAYAVVAGKGYSWQEALTAVLLAGILFFASGALGLRNLLFRGFPEPLKHSMTISLGLMIATIGLKNAGVLVMNQGFVSLGAVTHGAPLLALLGVVITGIFLAMGIRVAILAGIIATTILGVFMGVTDASGLSGGIVSLPPSISPIAMAFTFDASRILTMDFMVVIFTLMVIDIFDSLGTFIGVFNHFTPEEKVRYEAGIPAALMADAAATVTGACFGVSTVTTFVESSTGIQVGGRTGLTAVFIAVLTTLALFASPLFLMVPAAATAPALVLVGMFMMAMSRKIEWLDVSEGRPSLMMLLVTAFTMSISDGLMFGWIGYMIFKLVMRRWRDLNPTVIVVGLFFIARLILM